MANSSALAHDWTHWRGPRQNGVSFETNLPEKFDPTTPGKNNLVWKAPYACRSTPVVMNGRVYFIGPVGDGIQTRERVVCLDANSGKEVWEHQFNVFFTDIVTVRLGWTNLAGDPETGNVYAHGTQGFLFCFDKDGKIVWQHQLTEEYGRISGYGGRVCSPIIEGNLVIVGMLNASWGEHARGGNRFVAFDKKTGEVVWWAETGMRPRNTYYSVPVVTTVKGQRLMVTGGGDGAVHAFQVNTGKKLWSLPVNEGGINSSPVADGNLIYIAHGKENLDNPRQGAVLCIDASQVKDGEPKVVWKEIGYKVQYASPILHAGRLYVCEDSARMNCLDAKTGKRLWRFNYGRNAKGSPVWADGKIYVAPVNAHFLILKPGDKKCEELHDQFFRGNQPGIPVEINGTPAIANGRIYFGTSDEFYCLGKPDAKSAPAPLPKPEEQAKGVETAYLRVTPAEVALKPGESVQFRVEAFDEYGNFLGEPEAEWSLAPMRTPPPLPGRPAPAGLPTLKGKITKDGKLTVPADLAGQFGGVVAKVGKLEGRARVRQVGNLPYSQNFDKVPEGRTPGGWVNTQGKFAVRKVGDSNVLVKNATSPSPLAARANAYIGTPHMKHYVIAADAMAGQVGDTLPEMGVINQRYNLWLEGGTGLLRLTSWDALPRVNKSISFNFKPNVWYRLKLVVDIEEGKGIARGKVWEKGKPEPKEWTIEVEDPIPNTEGTPALYATATGINPPKPGAEVYFDNVTITPRKK